MAFSTQDSGVSACATDMEHVHCIRAGNRYFTGEDEISGFSDYGHAIAFNLRKTKLNIAEKETAPELKKFIKLKANCKSGKFMNGKMLLRKWLFERRSGSYIVSGFFHYKMTIGDLIHAVKEEGFPPVVAGTSIMDLWNDMEDTYASHTHVPTLYDRRDVFVPLVLDPSVEAAVVNDEDIVVVQGEDDSVTCRMTPVEKRKFQNIFETVTLQLRTQLNRIDIAIRTQNWNMIIAIQKRLWNSLDFLRSQILQTMDFSVKGCAPTRTFKVKKSWSAREKMDKYVNWLGMLTRDLNAAEKFRPFDEKGIVMSAMKSIKFAEDIVHEFLPQGTVKCSSESWTAQSSIRTSFEPTQTSGGSTNWGDIMDEADAVADGGEADLGEDVETLEQNLVFSDARGVIEDSTFETGDVLPVEDETCSATDRPWDLQMMSQRPWLTFSTNWSKDIAAGHVLFQHVVPFGLVDPNSCPNAFSMFTRQFTFVNSGFEIRFQVNGTKFHQGRLICAFMPYITTNFSSLYSMDNLVNCPHVILDASISNSGVLTIPFAHMFSNFLLRISKHYDDYISPMQTLGVLTVRVFNPLRAGPSTTSDLTVNIFSRMIKPKFSVLLPEKTGANVAMNALASRLMRSNKPYFPVPPSDPYNCAADGARSKFHAQSGMLKSVAGTVGGVASTVGAALQGVGRFAEDFAGNCDKPQLPLPPDPIVLRVAAGMAPGDGLDLSQRLALEPDSYTMTTSAQTMSEKSDMSLRSLCETYSRLGTITWVTSDAANKLMFEFPLAPTVCKYLGVQGLGEKQDIQYIPTSLGYCSRPFMYWRGSLKVKLQIVSTQMHSGRIGITLFYHGDRLTQQETAAHCRLYQPTVVWDIQEKKEIEIEVPYNAIVPWMRCDKFVYAYNEAAATDGPEGLCEPDTGTVGMAYSSLFSMSVMSKLVCPSNVFQAVDINVFIAAGPDFELCNPSLLNMCTGFYNSGQNMDLSTTTEFPTYSDCCFVAQAGKATQQDKLDKGSTKQKNITSRTSKSQLLTPQPRVNRPKVSNMPEVHMDLKSVLRRYYQICSVVNKVTITPGWHRYQISVNPFTAVGVPENDLYEVKSNMDLVSWYAQMFSFWRGSMRYKIVNPTQGGTMIVTYHPHVATPNGYDVHYSQKYTDVMEACNTGTVLVAGSAAAVVEVEVPFFSRYRMLSTTIENDGGLYTCAGSLIIWIETLVDVSANSQAFHVPIYKSIADDFVFSLRKCPPTVRFFGNVASPPVIGTNWSKWCGSEYQKRLNDQAPYYNEAAMRNTSECNPAPTLWRAQAGEDESDVEIVEPDAVEQVLNGFVTTQKKIGEACDNLTLVSQKIAQDFPAIIDATNRVASMADTVNDLAEGSVPWSKIMSIGVTLNDIFTCEDWTTRFTKILVLSSLLGFEAETMLRALAHAVGFSKDTQSQVKSGFEAQAGWYGLQETLSKSVDWVGDLVRGIGSAVYSTITGVLPSMETLGPYVYKTMIALKGAHFVGQGLRGIEAIWRWISSTVMWAYEWAIGVQAPGFLTWHYLNLTSDKIGKWLSQVPEFYGEECIQRIMWNDDEMFRLYRYHEQGMTYVKELSKDKTMALTSFVRIAMGKLDNTIQEFQKSHCGPTVRVDPFCVAWFGAAGVGKSAGMLKMMHEVMDEMEYPRSNRVYHRNDNDQYWSGYTYQTSVFIDDFYSRTDSEVVKEFITLKSNCAYPLNMASVEEKGKMFKSHFIWMTTNTAYPAPNEVVHQPALLRRRNMLVRVRKQPGHQVDDIEAYRFDICDSNRDVVLVANLTWSDMKDRIIANSTAYLEEQKRFVLGVVNSGESYVSPNLARDLLRGKHSEEFVTLVDKLVVQDPVSGRTCPFKQFQKDLAQHEGRDTTDKSFTAQVGEVGKTTEALEWLDARFFRAAQIISESGDRQQENVMKSIAQTIARYKASLDLLGVEQMNRCGGFTAVIDQEFSDSVDIVDGKVIAKPQASSAMRVILDLLLEDVDMDTIVKAVTPFKLMVKNAAVGWYEKWSVKIKEALLEASSKMGQWLDAHPKTKVGIKIVTGLLAVCASMKCFAFMAPNLYQALEVKLIKLLGISSGPGLVRSVARHVLSSDANDAIDQDAVCAYGERYTEPPMARFYERLRKRFGWSRAEAQVVVEEFQSQSLYTAHNYTKAPVKPPVVTMHGAVAQSDLLVEQLETRIIPNNGMVMSFSWQENGESCTLEVRGLAIGGRDVLVPKHFFQRIPPGQKFTVKRRGKPDLDVFLITGMTTDLRDLDLTIVKMPVAFGSQKRITHHFVGESELGFNSVPITFNCYSLAGCGHSIVAEAVSSSLKSYTHNGVEICNQVGWRYPIGTKPGECGAVLLAHDTRLRGRIIGLHVAGTGEEGFSLVVTKEMLDGFGFDVTAQMVAQAEEIVDNIVPPRVNVEGNFTVFGTVPNKKAVSVPKKTDIKPSCIFEMVRKRVTEPSVLVPGDVRNVSGKTPLQRAVIKYGVPPKPIDPNIRKMVKFDMMEELFTWRVPFPKRLLTTREVILGDDTVEYLDRMNMQTSPGYPYVLSKTGKGKAYLFNIDKGEVQSEQLKQRLIDREVLALDGQRAFSVWIDCLKDERRPLQKIADGKTRLFTIPPVDFTMMVRKYFMSFVVAFYANHNHSFSAVGIDPYSKEWTFLFYDLTKISDRVIAGDYGSFDGMMMPDVMLDVGECINEWYEGSRLDDEYRILLIDEMIHTLQLCINVLYMSHQGNPSGNPITVVLNTMVNAFYIRCAWIDIMLKVCPKYASLEWYHKFVVEKIYGDDIVVAVALVVQEFFNQESLTKKMQDWGLEFTDETKQVIGGEMRMITDVTFLKNGFAPTTYGLVKATMSKDTIYELTNWIRRSDDDADATRDNCLSALRFAYFWGREFFDDLLNSINTAFRQVGMRAIIDSYDIHDVAFQFDT